MLSSPGQRASAPNHFRISITISLHRIKIISETDQRQQGGAEPTPIVDPEDFAIAECPRGPSSLSRDDFLLHYAYETGYEQGAEDQGAADSDGLPREG